MTVIHEFHGGPNDGLRLPNMEFHSTVAVPMDVQIRNPQDYQEWIPAEGQRVGIYVFRGPARKPAEGPDIFIHHLYLHHVEVLSKAPGQ